MSEYRYKQNTKIAFQIALVSLTLSGILFAYFGNFKYVFETVSILFLVWFIYFIITYFRVLKNHELQNVFINQYIHSRGYVKKTKTPRQKIQDLKMIQKYNQDYNSNFNNFTKFSTNLATNQDFTFDFLQIQQHSNKNRLARLYSKT